MKTPLLAVPLLVLTVPVLAQTSSTVHHAARASTGTTAHTESAGGCIRMAPLSPQIPALPASAPCEKALYTITRIATVKADYVSPLISPALREALETGTQTFTLGYIDYVVGAGPLATLGKYISVKYTGYLTDGTKFDSSDDHPGKEPIDLPYGAHQVIQGWDTGFEGMHVGGKRRLFVPYQLAYGDAGKGPIPPKSELIFDVELVGVSDGPPKRTQPPTPDVKQTTPPAGAVHLPNTATPPVQGSMPAQTAPPTPGSESKK